MDKQNFMLLCYFPGTHDNKKLHDISVTLLKQKFVQHNQQCKILNFRFSAAVFAVGDAVMPWI